MRAQRENLNIVFGKMPSEIISERICSKRIYGKKIPYLSPEEDVSYKSVPENLFVDLALSLKSNYSRDERKEQHKILLEDMAIGKALFKSECSVFNAVFAYADSVLTTNRYVPICKYDCLLKWNDISHYLGQDLFTTVYLAFKDELNATETNFFAWNPIIDTTNERLYKMLEQGLAENHYHLYGSSQCLHINWLSIMNQPVENFEKFKELDENLTPRISYSQEYNMVPWSCKLIWAAFVRCYLFEKVNIRKNFIVYESETETAEGEKNDARKRSPFLTPDIVISVLNSKNLEGIQCHLSKLAKKIKSLQYIFGIKTGDKKFCFDYALLNNLQKDNYNYNRILAGERKFLYDCFREYAKGNFSDFDCNVFYLYLLIKTEFRQEFIQSNQEYGFKNFANFQSRKQLFLQDKEYFDESVRLALNMPLDTQNLVSFEVRITPEKKEGKLKKRILSLDTIFWDSKYSLADWHKLRTIVDEPRKYHYVIHYPKSIDNSQKNNDRKKDRRYIKCRNSECRKNNRKYTDELVNQLKDSPYLRDAIKGIDACSNEIGCRPEVFATDFRYLRQVIPNNRRLLYRKNEKPVQLRLSYHVGEDFLNLTDGLRAIDEALLFLNMRRCDRLGHALALGIDADKYYQLKGNRIIMPKQDALDDDVWLLYKANELNIQIEKSLEQQMIYRIQDRIRYIYGNVLRKNNVSVDPFVYHMAWMLRGDNPELYRGYKYNDTKFKSFGYDCFMVNNEIPAKTIREDADAVRLYCMYHYDDEVKQKGSETEVLKITPDYIKLVKQIQKKMQFLIAEKGIAIECNPSSNYLIGTFRRYDAHPITVFNNTFLEHRQDELINCAQISVSINTDDQGVFDTSLTNEYALLALALEKKHDLDGNRLYSASNIYQYLDWVRKMGIEQTFGY